MDVEADRSAGPEVDTAVLATLKGNTEAYARVVERYQQRLFALALMTVRDRAGAEDVVQEAFVRAYAYLHRYDRRRPFYPWLATIAVRLGREWLRGGGREVSLEGSDIPVESRLGATTDLLGDLIDDQRSRDLWQSVVALPRGERMAVLFYYRQEMRLVEVAEVLGVSTGTVKTLLYRARKKLRRAVADQVGGNTPDEETENEL